MKKIDELTAQAAGGIEFILTDIDDTLTRDGYLLPEAFSALWELQRRGYCVIPVTGRPAGWCDLIIRQWPVDAVVGENGAFALYRTSEGFDSMIHPSVAPKAVQEGLKRIQKIVTESIPGIRVARDQPFRRYDLALDFAEDPPRFGMETAMKIKEICEGEGATAKISSIHVNTWFGDYSKLDMVRELLTGHYGIEERFLKEQVFFCGDSPNDEPMFSFFPLSCGVANIRPLLKLMQHHPEFITELDCGTGFAEAAEIIIKRGKKPVPKS